MEYQNGKKVKKTKIKKVAAIEYDKKYSAPTVIAKGVGIVAENILKVAETENIAVVENAELVEELNKIELGSQIPPELYQVVAEILVFVSDIDELKSRTMK